MNRELETLQLLLQQRATCEQQLARVQAARALAEPEVRHYSHSTLHRLLASACLGDLTTWSHERLVTTYLDRTYATWQYERYLESTQALVAA
jgi:hypothetical protein